MANSRANTKINLFTRSSSALLHLLIGSLGCFSSLAAVVNYDILYVRQPRHGDTENTIWPEVFHPARLDAGADLVLLRPDGSSEVLVAGGNGGVTDPFISFDGQWCYYTLFPDLRQSALNGQRGDLPYEGCDIYKIHLQTRQIVRLTFQEFTPNTGAGLWNYADPSSTSWQRTGLGYGILNLGPCPVPGGRIAFTSNRNAYTPPKGFTNPTLQLFVMDEDGKNVTFVAPLNIGSALHPTPLQDGRIMFSSYESQGLRDQRMWGIWSIWPDGRVWEPVISAFHSGQAFHFMTQISNGDLVVVDYYNLNNNGFGALYRLPPAAPPGQSQFHNAFADDAPGLDQTIGNTSPFSYPFTIPFQPRGMYAMTPFTHPQDEAAPVGEGGERVGKFTHPSAAPNNDLLVVWTPGPANDLNRPTTLPYYDAGLYLIPDSATVTDPSQLILIKNDPNYNEAWPRAVVPWNAVHATDEPVELPWLPNDGTDHPDLPPGTPYGIVGTSSFYKRESFPGVVSRWSDFFDGLDAFNTGENGQSSNWEYQGSDAGRYSNSDIHAVRVVVMEPNSHRSYGPNSGGPSNDGNHFVSHARERLRILGEIPLRKFDAQGAPILDPEGNPDTSFMAKLPADTPFTFQMLDKDGLTLTMAQTWHQVRPGEVRNNCGGCHAHSQQPLSIRDTFAGQADYQPIDLTTMVTLLTKDSEGQTTVRTNPPGAVNVEFLRDIRPLLQRSCVPCHSTTNAQANLVLDDYATYHGLPGDYARLADDSAARWGYPPVINNRTWRQSNASRYIRMFQSRRSLLIWKIFGRRLDGWTNADHPTETVAGDPGTLPQGADPNHADLDYTGDIMPPPGSGVAPLSDDEKMMFARWVDLGCPINTGAGDDAGYGWFLDEQRPTVTVSSPRPNRNAGPLSEVRVGVSDAYTGINPATLSVKADFPVNGLAAGAELVSLGTYVAPGIFSIPLQSPISSLNSSHVTAAVADLQGNTNVVEVRFWVETGFRIISLDGSALSARRLTIRFENPTGATNHLVEFVQSLVPPSGWSPLTILTTADEPNQTRRVDVEVPEPVSGYLFLRVQSP
jgi:hypothetical protein